MVTKVLAVGGTDPLSGAGIVADALTIAECGAHPLTVATATVDQDSTGVRGFDPAPEPWFTRSLEAALRDGRPDAIKVGMVGDAAHAAAIAAAIRAHARPGIPVVVDPVLSGGIGDGRAAFGAAEVYAPLLGLAGNFTLVLTPNADELGGLLGSAPPGTATQLRAMATELAASTGAAVLAKGGHVEPRGTDVAVLGERVSVLAPYPGPDEDVHGTGCRLASALASAMARGAAFPDAVTAARSFMAESLAYQTARVGCGRLQFVPAFAVLRGESPFDTEPVPRPDRASEESSE